MLLAYLCFFKKVEKEDFSRKNVDRRRYKARCIIRLASRLAGWHVLSAFKKCRHTTNSLSNFTISFFIFLFPNVCFNIHLLFKLVDLARCIITSLFTFFVVVIVVLFAPRYHRWVYSGLWWYYSVIVSSLLDSIRSVSLHPLSICPFLFFLSLTSVLFVSSPTCRFVFLLSFSPSIIILNVVVQKPSNQRPETDLFLTSWRPDGPLFAQRWRQGMSNLHTGYAGSGWTREGVVSLATVYLYFRPPVHHPE